MMQRRPRLRPISIPAEDIPPRPRDAEQLRREIEEDTISHMNYIKMYLAGRLALPDQDEIPFAMPELDDIEALGTGSYGTVRRMLHRPSGNEMAVKRVRITNSGSDDVGINQSMKRLRHEVEAIKSASDCENIVRFYGLTFNEGDAWVCMELMDISLEHLYQTVQRVGEGKSLFDETTLGAVAISVIKALTHMKDQYHIIHRDIKPSNILLNKCGAVKVCDFGICGYLQDSVAQTREAGCRPYMAPEKLSSRNYDIRSDVWSLGLTMIEVANFAYPYPGFNEAPVFTQLQMVVYEDPPMVRNTGYSRHLRHFTNMCVIKDYRERPNFMDLMRTSYYAQYENVQHVRQKVADYVSEMLPHRENIKQMLSTIFSMESPSTSAAAVLTTSSMSLQSATQDTATAFGTLMVAKYLLLFLFFFIVILTLILILDSCERKISTPDDLEYSPIQLKDREKRREALRKAIYSI